MPTWNELFKKEEHRWREPHELVKVLAAKIKNLSSPRCLDLGCGAGRHLVYLAHQGIRVDGMDSSAVGIDYARQWLRREGLDAALSRADMTALPYAGGSFQAVLSIYVIYHNPRHLMRKSIEEIWRVLKPGGWVAMTFQTTRSGRFGKGVEVEPNTFVADEGVDSGETHHYSTLLELAQELNLFTVHRIQLDEQFHGGYHSSHWLVLAEKPVS